MKNLRKLIKSLKNNNFHPLNFFVPWDLKQIKPYEVMLDGTVVSMYSFLSETQDNQEFLLKISTNEKRQYNENLIYMIDNHPECMLEKCNSFSFTEQNGRTFYYTVFKMIDWTVDEFIDNRLEFSIMDEIWMHKNSVNPSFINQPQKASWNIKLNSPEPIGFYKDDEPIRENEVLYLWKQIIYAFADLQKARIWHRDVRPSNIAILPNDETEIFDNRKSDFTTQSFGNRNSHKDQKYVKVGLRETNINSYFMNRNTGTDSNGRLTQRNKSSSNRMFHNYYEPSLEAKQFSCEDATTRYPRSSDTYAAGRSTGNRFTNGSSSTMFKRNVIKIINFDSADVIDHSVSDQDLEFGIEMKDYPCNNDIYASQYVIDYIEANWISPEQLTGPDSLKIKKMIISGSRKGKRYRKRINPFKEDVFACGMTLLQLASLYKEEDMMSARDYVLNNQYSEAFSDIKFSFILKLYLRYLLVNDSDERPDFIMAKKVFDQMFSASKDISSYISDSLEGSMDIDKWNTEMILEAINTNFLHSESKLKYQTVRTAAVDYDTPKPTDVFKQNSSSRKGLANSRSQWNFDDNGYGPIVPLRLDDKFSEVEAQNFSHKNKVTEYLELMTESNPRVLPMSKIINQRNPFHKNKTIMCEVHNKPATQACLMLHYGQYFCNSCNHQWGEVEDIEQSSKLRDQGLQVAEKDHNELVCKAEALNNRRLNTEDIDLIFYVLFDSVKCLYQDIKHKSLYKNENQEQIANFMQKIERAREELKWIKAQVEDMYIKKDYYGIYKWKIDYQLKLNEISETKEDIKKYVKVLNSEIQASLEGSREAVDSAIDLVRQYFHARGKVV